MNREKRFGMSEIVIVALFVILAILTWLKILMPIVSTVLIPIIGLIYFYSKDNR